MDALDRKQKEAAAAQQQAEETRAADAAAHARRMLELEQLLRNVAGSTAAAQQQTAALLQLQQTAQQDFAAREAALAAQHAEGLQGLAREVQQLRDALAASGREHERRLAVYQGQLVEAHAAVQELEPLAVALQQPPSRGWAVPHDEQAAALAAMPYLREDTFNIVVCGESGRGKSTLINALLRAVGKDGTAETGGLGEVTREATRYAITSTLAVVDVPGCGTVAVPTSEYITRFHLRLFDAVVLVTAGRLSANDVLLYRCLQAGGISRLVVRNKMDLDVGSELEKLRRRVGARSLDTLPIDDVQATCRQVRAQVLASYAQLEGVDAADVFLVSAEAMDPERTPRMGYPVAGMLLDEARFLAEVMKKTLAGRAAGAPRT